MSRYRITPEARADLREIYRFIARDNRPAAIRMQERFIERFKQLARHPQLGPPRTDLGDDIRITSVGNYAILYRPVSGSVEVIQVIHRARDLPAVFRPPSE